MNRLSLNWHRTQKVQSGDYLRSYRIHDIDILYNIHIHNTCNIIQYSSQFERQLGKGNNIIHVIKYKAKRNEKKKKQQQQNRNEIVKGLKTKRFALVFHSMCT